MASLRECARNIREDAADGIAWIAVWKEGRSWNAEPFYPEDFDYGCATMKIEADDFERLQEIMKADPAAMFVNGYYTNIGCHDDGTLPDVQVLVDALRWQYEDCQPLVSDWAIEEVI